LLVDHQPAGAGRCSTNKKKETVSAERHLCRIFSSRADRPPPVGGELAMTRVFPVSVKMLYDARQHPIGLGGSGGSVHMVGTARGITVGELVKHAAVVAVRAALLLCAYTILNLNALARADTPTDAELGNGCGEPEISDPGIVRALNAKIGQFGGPPQRVVAIRGAAPLDQNASDRHTRCHGTLVFMGGRTEIGLLLQDSVNGVKSWRWHSDLELAQGGNSPAQKKRMAEIYEDMRMSAVRDPDKVVSCGVEGPQTVYTANAVCYAVIKLVADKQDILKPYAGYWLLQDCGRVNSGLCLGIVEEIRTLSS
jgi:hypothetical protein